MEPTQELISKKELLQTYGISYGALYRWKRKGLIPESWFLRMATATGQETFFRREDICRRVEAILRLRDEDNVPMDDMAQVLRSSAERTRLLELTLPEGTVRYVLSELSAVRLTDSQGGYTELLQILKEMQL